MPNQPPGVPYRETPPPARRPSYAALREGLRETYRELGLIAEIPRLPRRARARIEWQADAIVTLLRGAGRARGRSR